MSKKRRGSRSRTRRLRAREERIAAAMELLLDEKWKATLRALGKQMNFSETWRGRSKFATVSPAVF